ncbi:MAG: ABC transporter permease [Gammaproteobacteria bacterium]|nr:ABC transporter permease [Gammaproteobacteria bacterium]
MIANYRGFMTLCRKEIQRFLNVSVQTVFAPLVSTLLYLLIFGQVMPEGASGFDALSYHQFLLPGLIMMAMLQNAFSNSSSSLIQSKMYRNLDLLLLSPLSPLAIFSAFVVGSVVRGLMVGIAIGLVASLWVPISIAHVAWVLAFALLTSMVLGALGFLAGLWAEKYDKLAAFQNFVILPLTFLSGVFYSVSILPPVWQAVTWLNPFFYMVDGFRYGVLGVSDVSPWLSLAITFGFMLALSLVTVTLLAKGWKTRR